MEKVWHAAVAIVNSIMTWSDMESDMACGTAVRGICVSQLLPSGVRKAQQKSSSYSTLSEP